MVLDAAVIIRAGSSLLYALLGLGVLWVGRRSPGGRALGTFLLGYGVATILSNVIPDAQRGLWFAAAAIPLAMAYGLGALAMTLLLPTRAAHAERWALAVGALALCVYVAGLFGLPDYSMTFVDPVAAAHAAGRPVALHVWFTLAGVVAFLGYGAAFTIVSARVAFGAPDALALRRSLALMAPLGALILNSAPFFGPTWLGLAAMLALCAFPAACWLVAAARLGSRFAVAVALSIAALGAGAYLYLLVPGNGPSTTHDIFGLYGVLRIVGWVILVHAIVRLDLLGVPLPRLALSRGTVAAGALATLFIVAQVAQNFLSAEYGLVMGGVVAGTMVFAAQPLQRAFERMGGAHEPMPSSSGPRKGRNDETYRAALRVALQDRRLTRDEELALAEVAERLGLGARRAAEIRHDVEREKGVA